MKPHRLLYAMVLVVTFFLVAAFSEPVAVVEPLSCAVAVAPLEALNQPASARIASRSVLSETLVTSIDLSTTFVESITASPDLRRVAWVGKEGDRFVVFVDGKKISSHGDLRPPLVFSPDSQRFAYGAMSDQNIPSIAVGGESVLVPGWAMVVDGVEGKGYLTVGKPVFSPDSRHVAHQALSPGVRLVTTDGREDLGRITDAAIEDPAFSPDSQHVAFAIQYMASWYMAIDGRLGKKYRDVPADPRPFGPFSPDSKRTAYAAMVDKDRWLVVSDDQEGQVYDDVMEPIFSPDSRRLVYAAKKDNQWFLVLDGKQGQSFDEVSSPVFSPNSESIAYAVRTGNEWYVCLNGEQGAPYDAVAPPRFSPSSLRVAYAAQGSDKWHAVVDGRPGKPYAELGTFPTFSPNSQHLAYVAQVDDKWTVVVDESEGKTYEAILAPNGDGIKFDSDTQLHYLAFRDNAFYLIEEQFE